MCLTLNTFSGGDLVIMQEGSEHFKALNEIQGITAHDKEYEIAFLADDILLSLSETQASIQCLGEA